MKTNALMDVIRKETPKDVTRRIDLATSVANRLYDILEERGLSQKEFARQMEKTEAEVSRWLSGTHNFTFATIAKIESVLGTELLFCNTPQPVKLIPYFIPVAKHEDVVLVDKNKKYNYKPIYKYEKSNFL